MYLSYESWESSGSPWERHHSRKGLRDLAGILKVLNLVWRAIVNIYIYRCERVCACVCVCVGCVYMGSCRGEALQVV